MVRLYVKSVKKAVGKENIVIEKPFFQYLGSRAFPGNVRYFPIHDVMTVTKYEYELPEEQEKLVEIVTDVASKLGFKLEVIDVTKRELSAEDSASEADKFATVVQSNVEDHSTRVPVEMKELKDSAFPVLATESDTKLATNFSREDVERFLSHRTKTEEKKS
jgi:hypothetical protein